MEREARPLNVTIARPEEPNRQLPAYQETRLRREDVGGVRRSSGMSAVVEGRETDTALDDERLKVAAVHLAESPPSNRIEGKPRFESHFDSCSTMHSLPQ